MIFTKSNICTISGSTITSVGPLPFEQRLIKYPHPIVSSSVVDTEILYISNAIGVFNGVDTVTISKPAGTQEGDTLTLVMPYGPISSSISFQSDVQSKGWTVMAQRKDAPAEVGFITALKYVDAATALSSSFIFQSDLTASNAFGALITYRNVHATPASAIIDHTNGGEQPNVAEIITAVQSTYGVDGARIITCCASNVTGTMQQGDFGAGAPPPAGGFEEISSIFSLVSGSGFTLNVVGENFSVNPNGSRTVTAQQSGTMRVFSYILRPSS